VEAAVINHKYRLIVTAILVGWSFDALFWEKSLGISFAIFIGISLGVGILLGRGEKTLPTRNSLLLMVPIVLLSIGTFIRKEPITTVTNIFMTLLLLGVFAHTYRIGDWLNYSLGDYILVFFNLLLSAFQKPWIQFSDRRANSNDTNGLEGKSSSKLQRVIPTIRGLLLAIPVLMVFTALLASADPIFEKSLNDFIYLFTPENLPEYIFRGFYIFILGYILAGIYIHAYTQEKREKLFGEEKPWLPRFLGFTESIIVIGGIDLLFSIFVGFQFKYFFGGTKNINIEGFTYAEYARRGFSELVIVAFFSLLLFLGLSTISRRESAIQQKIFSGTGIGMFFLVAIILISAFQRLSLYEQAYGFTRLRTYSHVFMIWLGILLATVVILELINKQRKFALAALCASFGFVLSLNIINVDNFIVHQNIQRATEGEKLDAYYFTSLSSDAIPGLFNALDNPDINENDKIDLTAVLACKSMEMAEKKQVWSSYHYSDAKAENLLISNQDELINVQVLKKDDGSLWVNANGKNQPCLYLPNQYD
jgi:hypothetical protein